MTKKIGNVRKKFLKRERVMLIIEHLTRSEVQNHWTSAQRKRWMDFLASYEENVEMIVNSLRYQAWKPGDFIIFRKREGHKIRTIYESRPVDMVVDTLWFDCLMYVFFEQKRIIPDTCYGSIKGKGQHELRRKIIKLVHGRRNLYAYVGDTGQYYPSMNHEVLMRIFHEHIKDKWLLWLCGQCIGRIDGLRGIALGLPSSNPVGHIYHATLDWMMKLDMKVRRYYRFCDDKWMFHRDVNYLHTAARMLRDETQAQLDQRIKPTWRILNCTEERFECLGAMVNSHGARLRTFSRRRMERQIKTRIRQGNPMMALKTWSGFNGSLRDLNVLNLINYWREVYPEFFHLIRWARAILRERQRRKRWHKRIEKILTKAPDRRNETNRKLYPYGLTDTTKNTPTESTL